MNKMATELARPRYAAAVVTLALALLAVLAWRVTSLGMADRDAATAPALALAWRKDHPEALLLEAERLAALPGRQADAAGLARRAIRANPLDGRPYRVLGRLAAASGDMRQADALHAVAARRSPRDLASHSWMVKSQLERGDAVAAFRTLDLMMRVAPGQLHKLQSLLIVLASHPASQGALFDQLVRQPPWRERVLTMVMPRADVAGLMPLVERLRLHEPGLSPLELKVWLDRLTYEGLWGQAYVTWASELPPERLKGLGNLANGGFEWEPTHTGFDWRFSDVAGARMDRVSGPGVTGKAALRVSFEGRRVPFSHVRQLLAIPAGRYVLSGRSRPDGLRTERGLVWTLTCAQKGELLGETEPLRGSGEWRDFSLDFEVPAQGCGGQWLTLRLPARIPAEQRIAGRAWFDDLKVVRRP